MPKKRSDLSKTELILMNICWKKGTASARDVFEETLKVKKRGYQTVKTMLDRMVSKGYLSREKFGPIWLYKPLVSRAQIIAGEIDSFVSNVLDHTFTPLFAHFAEKENLSHDEIETLKKIIEEYEENE
ncbi:MAG: BlaI/MecI/CopY family transcriptional regulator [Candidatus Latescibacteria bacterium]|nr:BlaI/MecI/CopY family transcriptional regulator [Candidatus Latescibacterota bacterium]